MEKHEIVERLCSLASEVGSVKFKSELCHDCFCDKVGSHNPSDFRFEEDVLRFIEESVREKLSKYAVKIV